eukprot:scaffold501_cov145-Skeletonema_menzelii.AAC.8
MADDMHAIIVADEEKVIKEREEEEKKKAAAAEPPVTVTDPSNPPSNSKPVGFFKTISMRRNRSSVKKESMADDIHTIIVADEDKVIKRKERRKRNQKAEEEKKKTEDTEPPVIDPATPPYKSIRFLRRNKSSVTKQTSPCEEEANEEQPSASRKIGNGKKNQPPSPNMETKGSTTTASKPMKVTSTREKEKIEANAEQPISSGKEAKGTSSGKVVKGGPLDLAKLMTKLDKQASQVQKLQQELSKTKEEELATRKAIGALAAKFRDVLEESVASDNSDYSFVKQPHDDQTPDDQTACSSLSYDRLSDDGSETDSFLQSDPLFRYLEEAITHTTM